MCLALTRKFHSLLNNRRKKCTVAEIKTMTKWCFYPKPYIWSKSTEYVHAAFICSTSYASPFRRQTHKDTFQDSSSSISDARLCILWTTILSLMVPLPLIQCPAGEKGTVFFDIWCTTHAVFFQGRINPQYRLLRLWWSEFLQEIFSFLCQSKKQESLIKS